ncbi:MAG: hypothetical protein MZU79_00690 [Anaerotruncus sp.]|nr:hypothetical protein [Anaerotruncus sp.]
MAESAGAGRREEARRRQRRSARSGRRSIDPASRFVTAADAAPAGQGLDGVRERARRDEGRSAAPRRRLRRGGAAQVPRRREAPGRPPVRDRAVQEPASRDFNVRAIDLPAPRERREPAAHRRLPPDAAGRRLQRLRLGALRARARQPRDARHRVGGALRRPSRSSSTRPQYGGGGIFNDHAAAAVDSGVRRLHLRPRVRPPLRGARRRVLHLRRRLRDRRARSARAVGAERHRAARTRPR